MVMCCGMVAVWYSGDGVVLVEVVVVVKGDVTLSQDTILYPGYEVLVDTSVNTFLQQYQLYTEDSWLIIIWIYRVSKMMQV